MIKSSYKQTKIHQLGNCIVFTPLIKHYHQCTLWVRQDGIYELCNVSVIIVIFIITITCDALP